MTKQLEHTQKTKELIDGLKLIEMMKSIAKKRVLTLLKR